MSEKTLGRLVIALAALAGMVLIGSMMFLPNPVPGMLFSMVPAAAAFLLLALY